MRIIWTDPAINDLGAARYYIALDNARAADKQIDHVVTTVMRLSQFPNTGRAGRRPGTRELVIAKTPFIVAYRVRGDTIEIVRVLHGRQRWPDAI